jgi:hypothetical protein
MSAKAPSGIATPFTTFVAMRNSVCEKMLPNISATLSHCADKRLGCQLFILGNIPLPQCRVRP